MINKFYFVLLFFSFLSYSQIKGSKVIYLDSDERETSRGKHDYYFIIEAHSEKNNLFLGKTYYKSGKIKDSGTYLDSIGITKTGDFITYFENGNKAEEKIFSTNKLIGAYKSWYENGNPKLVGEYIYLDTIDKKDIKFKINQFWNENNIQTVTNGKGEYSETEYNGAVFHGKLNEGVRDGEWNGKDWDKNISYVEQYKNGQFIYGMSIDKKGRSKQYYQLFSPPYPKNGIEHFYQFVSENFIVPKSADNITGRMFFSFLVDEDGNVTKVKVIKSLGFGLDEEGKRVIRRYPDWVPGLIRGLPAKAMFSIPITIQAQ